MIKIPRPDQFAEATLGLIFFTIIYYLVGPLWVVLFGMILFIILLDEMHG